MNWKFFSPLAYLCIGLAGANVAFAQQTYTVKVGDSLSSIAYEFYNDQAQWKAILEANPGKVSPDGALVLVGTVLDIPDTSDLQAPSGQNRPVPQTGFKRTNSETGRIEVDLVTGNDFKPYADKESPEGGLSTAIVARIFRDLGYEPIIEFVNWPSAFKMAQRGTFAGTFPYAPTDERKEDFFYSVSLVDDLTFAYWHKDRPMQFVELDDLKGHRVCRGDDYFVDFMDHLIESGEIDLIRPEATEDCWLALAEGEVEFVVQSEFETIALLADMGLSDQMVKSDVAIDARGYHMIFPKAVPESEQLRDEFDRTFRELEESGELNRMVERHLKAFFDSYENGQS